MTRFHLLTLTLASLAIALMANNPLLAATTPSAKLASFKMASKSASIPPLLTAKPTTKIKPKGCVTSACHASVKKHKKLHGPVNVNACDACHTLTDAKQHTYQLARPKSQLCTFCHKIEIVEDTSVHKPFAEGLCFECHDGHGGFNGKFLKSNSINQFCQSCHQGLTAGKKSVHGPVAAGACDACHLPHTSSNPSLLREPASTLCIGCHQEMAQQIKTVKFAHEPVVKGQCLDCHNPHASDFPMLVKESTYKLCTSCHKEIGKKVTDSKFKHSAVTEGRACANCHTPHGGDLAKLLKSKPISLCLNCHKEDLTASDGHQVPNVSKITDASLFKHGPIREGSCGGCHEVHGSDVFRLLAKPYPATFYDSFKLKNYDLCFSCHDKQLVLSPKANGLTGFRDGDANLHFLHVNKKKRGRTCRACHAKHASEKPKHIRNSVPYGKWELPINFEKNKSGGSCAPGCHKAVGYNRDHPASVGRSKEEKAKAKLKTKEQNKEQNK